ncbi:protein FAR1-RELATED SEQUENCE 5-like [Apium graveolens]|uniref:protein FAR1-RELATED SEQUENCE 5-like n=1 Tax=Apium graveolens TaxID=4045 RepID=UPI003D7A4B4F
MVFYYDFDNNKVIIDGVAYDGPEGEEDMEIALLRIQMALERKKKKKKMKLKRRRKSRRKRKTTIRVIKIKLMIRGSEKRIVMMMLVSVGRITMFTDSDNSNDSFNGDDDDKINDENFIGNMNDVVPCIGMMFDSLDEAESFYRGYGRRVNHHYQNILFGFALIRGEKETTYRWVLKTWLEAVDNKPPITIITDQDIALSNAISEVMPNTNHTYCTWHISSKFPEKLSTLYTQYSEFKTDFNACIYNSLSPTEFEGRWEDLKEKYDLENHNWLNDMYAIRRQWVFAFTKQHFAAGMTTTSRSESMNSFFDEYVKASTGLKEFIENSQKALDSQYLREVQADFDTEYKERRLFSNSSMEIHASKIYTKEMFKRFQKELQKSQSFVVKSMKGCGDYLSKMYLVEKSTLPEINRRNFFLKVSIDGSYSCTCKKFEHSGMICRHMIRYLNKKQKMMIPPDLVTMRWTINGNKVAGPLPCTPGMLGNVVESQTARYSGLCKAFQVLSVVGSCSVPRYNYLMSVIKREKEYVIKSFPGEKRKTKINEDYESDEEDDPLLDPPRSQTKGRPKAGRFKSGIETSSSNKQFRKCSFCGAREEGHDRRNCPSRLLGKKGKN